MFGRGGPIKIFIPYSLTHFLLWKHLIYLFGCGGHLKMFFPYSLTNVLTATLFLEQPLTLPRSANKEQLPITNIEPITFVKYKKVGTIPDNI